MCDSFEKKKTGIGVGGCACSYKKCGNRFYMKDKKKLSFFSFPKDVEMCKLWLKACGREELIMNDLSVFYKKRRICSMHFDSYMYVGPSKNRLLPTAIPKQYSSLPLDVTSCSEVKEVTGQTICTTEASETSLPITNEPIANLTRLIQSSTNTSPQTIILPSHSEQATQNATQGNSSHIEQVHIKEEPLEADPSDYRLYQQLRDSIKTEPVNSETDSTNGDPEKHTDSISTDKEHLVNVKKEYSDSSDNEISVNHETEQIPMFESVFVKAEPFEEDDF